jgi:hypothetical protein
MSQPGMAGPTSARLAEADFFLVVAISVVLLITLCRIDGLVDCWINGQRTGRFSIYPIVQKSNNPVSCFGCG